MYGGLETTASNIPPCHTPSQLSASASASAFRNSTPVRCKAPFSRATASASSEISVATIRAPDNFDASATAIAPLPVHMSNIDIGERDISAKVSFATHATSSSVSGRGIRTPSRTPNSSPQNSQRPAIYCTGRPDLTCATIPSSPVGTATSASGDIRKAVRSTDAVLSSINNAMEAASRTSYTPSAARRKTSKSSFLVIVQI